jgi:hypothetical protein
VVADVSLDGGLPVTGVRPDLRAGGTDVGGQRCGVVAVGALAPPGPGRRPWSSQLPAGHRRSPRPGGPGARRSWWPQAGARAPGRPGSREPRAQRRRPGLPRSLQPHLFPHPLDRSDRP